MVMVMMMTQPKLSTKLLVMTMLVKWFTVQMIFRLFHMMCMAPRTRMLQLLLFLLSCSAKLLAK